MELLSMFSGLDSLRKFLVMLGLVLISLGFIYPTQKKVEYEDNKIALNQNKKILSLEITRIEGEINVLESEINEHSKFAEKLRKEQAKFETGSQDFIRIEREVNKLKVDDLKKNQQQKDKIFETEKSKIKIDSLETSIKVMGSTICWLVTFQIMAIVIGAIFLMIGFRKWNKSEKNSFDIVETELDIRKEELQKLKKENNP